MSNELRIPFESLLNRGIQRELIDPNNNVGFLNNTYTQAFTLIKVICETSKHMSEAEKEGRPRQDEIHNVIAFTGRRGTGKTSAMLSIADSLSKLSAEKEHRFEISDTFVQLPYINAAVLDEEEDIFLIVLSRMFKELDAFSSDADRKYKKDFHDRARELKEEMCKIHGHYVNLKSNSDFTSSYYSMENLHAKYNIREEFAKLVKNYTEFYKTNNMTHLILCIDDVDMSRQDHMRIMQCIHQYFMIPNVVVMVTLNFPILTATLQKDTFDRLNTIEKREEQNLHLAFEHTHDFLRKIIPSDMRITMPSWRKYDYRNLTPVKVNLGKSANLDSLKKKFPLLKESVLFKKLSDQQDDDYMLDPKQLVLMMLADRTTVYLDVMGNKYHFMEPDSLRNLYDIFYMLYHMNDIASIEASEGKNDVYFCRRKANRKILLDYLYFKLLPEYDFSAEEEKLITDFLAEPMERRGKRIWDYYFRRLTSEEEKKRINSIYGTDFYEKEKSRYKIQNYSFGELFRILYNASRIGLMDRKLIRFILASFSFSLPQYVENEKWRNNSSNEEYPKSANQYRNLRNVFGYTLIGTWCQDLFNGRQVDMVIYKDEISKLGEKYKEENGSEINLGNQDDFKAFIEELMLLLLMTSKTTREPFIVGFDSKMDEDGEPCGFYRIENSIDPTAFLMNSLRIEERLENMKFSYKAPKSIISDRDDEGNVTYAISKLLHEIFQDIGVEISVEKFNNLVTGLLKSWKEDNPSFKPLWYFLKYTDIAYNVIKRAVADILYGGDNNLKDKNPITSTPFYTIQKFYKIVHEKIKEQDTVYFQMEMNPPMDSPTNGYAPAFLEHPVVKKFFNPSSDNRYSNSMKCCGIELLVGEKVSHILNTTKSPDAMWLLNKLPSSTLKVTIDSDREGLLTEILMSLDRYIIGKNKAVELINEIVDDSVPLEKIKEKLDQEEQMPQEDEKNAPPQ